jgi:dTDP-4-dehydrorhamnose reductase
MSNNILVTGCNGQLGSEFKNIESNYPEFNFHFRDRDLDISVKKSLDNFIFNQKINIILNTAAFTNVNIAEIEREKADLVNTFAVKNLVELSEKYNCKLIHFSTDYVYNSSFKTPMKENSKVNPVNYYGKSKRNGEIYVEKSISESIVIRTSWLYSCYGNNFVNTIIEKAKNNSEIHVVNDQYGCPTYAKDLANSIMIMIMSKLRLDFAGKIYNYSNLGSISWSGFAKKIIEYSKLKCQIREVSSLSFKSTAKRPKYSITSKNKIISNFNLSIPSWECSLKIYLKSLK